MSERKRMNKLAGIDEMAIKNITWDFVDGEPTSKEVDITAREFAKMAILDRLQQTGYWTEAHDDEYKKMTSREVSMVNKHIDKFLDSIEKMLKPKK